MEDMTHRERGDEESIKLIMYKRIDTKGDKLKGDGMRGREGKVVDRVVETHIRCVVHCHPYSIFSLPSVLLLHHVSVG